MTKETRQRERKSWCCAYAFFCKFCFVCREHWTGNMHIWNRSKTVWCLEFVALSCNVRKLHFTYHRQWASQRARRVLAASVSQCMWSPVCTITFRSVAFFSLSRRNRWFVFVLFCRAVAALIIVVVHFYVILFRIVFHLFCIFLIISWCCCFVLDI